MINKVSQPMVAINDLTWKEVDKMKEDVEVVIIPVGSTEQHGPHLCFSTDSTRAYQFSLRVAREMYPKVLVAPVIQVGVSPHHMDFPGTITLRPNTLINTIVDYVTSLKKHGFKRFMIINAHGGNQGTIQVATEEIRELFGIQIPFVNYKSLTTDVTKEVIGSKKIEHSGEWEVSDALFLAPEIVREDSLCIGGEGNYPYKYTDLYGEYVIGYPHRWKDVTETGNMGDARNASAEKGKRISDAALARVVEFLEDYIRKDK